MLASGEDYLVINGDTILEMAKMPPKSVDFCMYSPPFPQVYSYSSSSADLGNAEDLDHEVPVHFGFLFRQALKVMKPGRVMMVHCTQIIRMKRSGGEGTYDFRGLLIRLAKRAGFIYEYEWTFRRNPQAQAIKTRSRPLQFAGLEADRAKSRGAMPDFLIKFVAPGENQVPIRDWDDLPEGPPGDDGKATIIRSPVHAPQVTRNEWIEWAESNWTGIKETGTLNTKEAKSEEDVLHICPMPLGMCNRLVRLYSNPGEIVFDPFTGIGSTGYEALRVGRRFLGTELKPEYHATAIRNLERMKNKLKQSEQDMFPMFREEEPEPEPEQEEAVDDMIDGEDDDNETTFATRHEDNDE